MVQSMHLKQGERHLRSLENASKGKLTALALLSLGVGGLSLLCNVLLVIAFFSLSSKEPPVMVQLASGEAITMEPMVSYERTDAAISTFVQETMTLLMSASGQILDETGNIIRDYGVDLGDSGKITSVANIVSYSISESFRAAFLRELAKITNDDIFSAPDQNQTILVIQRLSDPIPIEKGKWKLIMIANLVRISEQVPEGEPTPFNKEIWVQSVTPPVTHEFDSLLAQEISQIRSVGLEIYEISNYFPGQHPDAFD